MQEENKQEEVKNPLPPTSENEGVISIDTFSKVDMKIGTVVSAEPIEGSEKLLKLSVDFGEEKPRQVISGIAKFIAPVDLIGKQCPFVTNLEPRKIMGLESQAMILAARNTENEIVILHPAKELQSGADLG